MTLVTDKKAWEYMTDNRIFTCKTCKQNLGGRMALDDHMENYPSHHTFTVGGSKLVLCIG